MGSNCCSAVAKEEQENFGQSRNPGSRSDNLRYYGSVQSLANGVKKMSIHCSKSTGKVRLADPPTLQSLVGSPVGELQNSPVGLGVPALEAGQALVRELTSLESQRPLRVPRRRSSAAERRSMFITKSLEHQIYSGRRNAATRRFMSTIKGGTVFATKREGQIYI